MVRGGRSAEERGELGREDIKEAKNREEEETSEYNNEAREKRRVNRNQKQNKEENEMIHERFFHPPG